MNFYWSLGIILAETNKISQIVYVTHKITTRLELRIEIKREVIVSISIRTIGENKQANPYSGPLQKFIRLFPSQEIFSLQKYTQFYFQCVAQKTEKDVSTHRAISASRHHLIFCHINPGQSSSISTSQEKLKNEKALYANIFETTRKLDFETFIYLFDERCF